MSNCKPLMQITRKSPKYVFAYIPLSVDLYYVMYMLHGNCFDSDSKDLKYITYLKHFLSNLTTSCSYLSKQRVHK